MSLKTSRSQAPSLAHGLAAVILLTAGPPSVSLADTAGEIRAEVLKSAAYAREQLRGPEGGIASEGALEFWSSGGLIQTVPADAPAPAYAQFSLTPKHIEVITLVEGQAGVAMYYSEGAYQVEGQEPVPHYLTRVTQVYVKEGGRWKLRAAHYSPITGGGGTSQTAVD